MTGSLRPREPVTAKNKNSFGFGAGRGHVVAAMSASLFSAGGRRQVLTFDAEPTAGKREAAVPPKVAAARNASIAAIVGAGGEPNERLSPDVETFARLLGRTIGDRVLAFAKEEGWLTPAGPAEPGQGTSEPPAKDADAQSGSAPDQLDTARPGT